jgi:uncharacterized LabA/DUF88 family protein
MKIIRFLSAGREHLGRLHDAWWPRCRLISKIVFSQSALLEQMLQQACFQRPIGMHRNREADVDARLAVDVVAALDSQQLPAVLLVFCR